MTETNFEAARSYVERGWAVLPIHGVVGGVCTCGKRDQCPTPGKHPRTKGGVNDATKDQGRVTRWWSQWPEANVAVATGEISGLFVVDIDPRNGGDASWRDFSRDTNTGDTREVSTGGGGRHYYYAYPTGERLAQRTNLFPGVDIKSNGGYVLAPPSSHASGGVYMWMNSKRIAFAPDELLACINFKLVGGVSGEGLATTDELLRVGIMEGKRDDTLLRVACREMRVQHGNVRAVRAIIQQLAQVCVPPFPAEEAEVKVMQALKYYAQEEQERNGGGAGAVGDEVSGSERGPWPGYGDYSDEGFAQRFAWLMNVDDPDGPRVRHTRGVGWFYWNEEVWRPDPGRFQLSHLAFRVQDSLQGEARSGDEKMREAALRAISRVKSVPGVRRVVDAAEFLPELDTQANAWDKHAWLLNCKNGILDLTDGTLHDHSRRALCTKQSPVDYDPSVGDEGREEWLKFLGWVVPNENGRRWLQRAVGYSLTADTSAKAFLILYGAGNNGKSTFLETVAGLLGDYAAVAAKSVYVTRRNDPHPEAVARLAGRRFVHSSEEVGDHDQLNVEMLKTLTGGDTIVSRHMHQESFEFQWQGKLWMATNHLPRVNEWGEALAKRMRLVRFNDIPRDKMRPLSEVRQAFKKEESGILRWAVEGAMQVFAMGAVRGLAGTDSMGEDADMAFSGQDVVRTWFVERWAEDAECDGVGVDELWEDFALWSAHEGVDLLDTKLNSKRGLGVRLTSIVSNGVKYRVLRAGKKQVTYRIRRK